MLTSSHRRGPLVVNLIVVAAMALAAVWRRRSPLVFLIVVGVLVIGADGLAHLAEQPAAGRDLHHAGSDVHGRRVGATSRAVLGLAIFICGTATQRC